MITRFSHSAPVFSVAGLLVAGLLVAANSVTASPRQCSSASADADGDGWGWENNASCVVAGPQQSGQAVANAIPSWVPSCTSANSDSDGDGYGFENGRSCANRGAAAQSSGQAATQPATQSGAQSNQASQSNNNNGIPSWVPSCSSATSDSDGDGYGFENGQSCAVRGSSTQATQATQASSQVSQANQSSGNHQIPSWVPSCSSSNSDSDGDGYGFENGKTCATRGSSNQSNQVSQSSDSGIPSWVPSCSSSKTDSDGDGYGFENGQTCAVRGSSGQANQTSQSSQTDQVTQSSANGIPSWVPSCNSTNSDPDGDGYGFENGRSCAARGGQSGGNETKANETKVSETKVSETKEDIPTVSAARSGLPNLNDITDVVLVTGQSNVLASSTAYDAGLDAPNAKVFAYTNSGWQVADLHQSWDRFQHPGNQSLNTQGRKPTNNFSLHFGKSLVARDPSRVVAFIVVPGPGRGISNWDQGTAQYNRITQKVTRALADIAHKNTVDAVLWHQGENDWLYEGTADANPTGFTSKDSYEYKNYYQIKLNALITNFRNESWGSGNTAFICGETRRAEGVNRRLMALNNDADPRTACVPATDLPKRADDQYGSHFSAEGLRALGKRYADAFYNMN